MNVLDPCGSREEARKRLVIRVEPAIRTAIHLTPAVAGSATGIGQEKADIQKVELPRLGVDKPAHPRTRRLHRESLQVAVIRAKRHRIAAANVFKPVLRRGVWKERPVEPGDAKRLLRRTRSKCGDERKRGAKVLLIA